MNAKRLLSIAQRVSGVEHTQGVRTAGVVEFKRDQGPLRRDIRTDKFEWNSETLKNLAKILWATERSHSYAMAALRLFSKMPSSEFSPDGLLGGRGYIQPIKDMRTGLSKSVEFISSFADTLYDEINADHWSVVQESDETNEIVDEAREIKSNPEDLVQQEFEGVSSSGEFSEIINPGPTNPSVETPGEDVEDEDPDEDGWGVQSATRRKVSCDDKASSSELPDDEDAEQGYALTTPEMVMKTNFESHNGYASAIKQSINKLRMKTATGAIDPNTLPGPRVEHLGPGEDVDNPAPSDDPNFEGFINQGDDYLYDGPDADGKSPMYPPKGDGSKGTVPVYHLEHLGSDGYSWLPGSRNEKNLDYYARGLTDQDIKWMRANSNPDVPAGMKEKPKTPSMDFLWEIDI
jgi:hypothetical protein